VVADFGGGMVSPDAGALLLGETDKTIRLIDRFAACFRDGRHPAHSLHEVRTLVAQWVFGLALGDEDLVDHDEVRRDPVLGGLGDACQPVAALVCLDGLRPALRAAPASMPSVNLTPVISFGN
jgi:hypothetical protein